MALLFYVQTVIDVSVDFFLRLESLFSSSGGGGIYFINCGCPSGNVRYCLSSHCICVRQSGIKRQWRAPDLCKAEKDPFAY
jgi:hypothetical protein